MDVSLEGCSAADAVFGVGGGGGVIDCCYDLNNEGCGRGTWKISKCNISPTLHAVLLHMCKKSQLMSCDFFVLRILVQKP